MNNMFSPTSGAGSAPELIPNGSLAWAIITIGGAKQSKSTGGTYYPVTLTIAGGEYEGRKVFDMLPDVQDDRNGEKWRKMGITSVTRIFESAGWFTPAKPDSYNMFNGKETLAIMNSMDGQRVAIKVKVEKNTDPAYADKNKVGEWLSPNPASGGFRDYQKLLGGQQAIDSARGNAFAPTQAPAPTVGASPGWIKTPGPSNAPF
jgi:hypothetical protein